ncbi:hypothetical protein B0G57_105178 [Trinickia symbiotica]|uniref:Uncharacterized protein n=1 Tax=Trinickia symbiotica TaxID=863227 RepID=A0A2N7X1E8_9BURK|nr:hypothetical protein [Trinickia symbiotica]PMS35444.1 hypothetical protein C0Z20_18335 [Trinickia symbiotica]PPK45470.1 hypothetical protein B0G57_105178 [Trinickia symbiotica]
MNKQQIFRKLSTAVLVCAVIAGCASQKQANQTTPAAFDKALADADAVAKGGDKDKALALYQQLTKADPTREEPWSRIAQIEFDNAHYGQAIVAAQEALQRDSTDRGAKSVLAVSGLRVATQSLGELRQDAELAGDAKTDAQALAHQLRDTLGQATLFPEEVAQNKPPVKKRRIVRRHPATVAKKDADPGAADQPAADAPAPKAAAGASGADPFSALR